MKQRLFRRGLILRLAVVAGFAAGAAIAAVMAFSYFSSTSPAQSNTVSAAVLNPPTTISATAASPNVTVSWDASTLSDGTTYAQSYTVERYDNGGADLGAACGGSTFNAGSGTGGPPEHFQCTDSPGAAGTYKYKITARYNQWTATSAFTNSVTITGAADHFLLSAASTTPTAGAADNLTITAKDSSNNTVTTYTGDKTLTFGGANTIGSFNPTVTDKNGVARNFGVATTITFSSGVASVSGSNNGVMTLYKAETASITVSDGSINNGAGLSVTVSADAANKLAFTQSPANTSAENALSPQPQVTVQDQFGNTVTGDSSSVTLSIKSGTPTSGGPGSLTNCAANPKAVVSGVATFSGCKITTVGTAYQLHATDGSLTAADSSAFDITPGAAAKLAFTQSPANTSADNALSPQPQVTVQDQFGNTVTGDSSSVTLSIKSGTPTSGGPGSLTNCAANPKAVVIGVATFSGCKITTVGTAYQLHATDGSLTAADSSAFDITPGAAAKLAFTQSPANTSADNALSPQPQVTVQDQFGNTVTGDSSSVTLSIKSGTPTSGGPGSLTNCAANPKAAVSGVATFSGCKITTVGTAYQLHATDGSLTAADSSAFDITAGAATKLVFTTAPQTITAGGAVSGTITVQRQDANSNATTQGGAITVTLSSTSGTGSFRNNSNNGTITSVPIASGGTSASFRYRDSTVGTPTITAASSPLTSATQTVTVNAAGTKTAVAAGGSWCAAATWSPSGVPAATDNVSITAATTVTIGSGCAAVANSFTLGAAGASSNTTVTFSASDSSLAVGGNVTINGPNSNTTRDLQVNAGTATIGGDLAMGGNEGGAQANRIAKLTLTTGSVTVSGNLAMSNNGVGASPAQDAIDMSGGGGTFNLAGLFTINNSIGTLTSSATSTFNFNGGAAQTIPIGVSSVAYTNLQVNNASTTGATLSAPITTGNVTGNLQVQSGTLDNGGNSITGNNTKTFQVAAGATLKLSGATSAFPTGYATFTVDPASTVDYAGTGAQPVAGRTYGNLIVDGGVGNPAKAAQGSLTVAGDLTIGSGTTLDMSGSNFPLTLQGDFTNNGGFNQQSSTITFNGSSLQELRWNINSGTFFNWTVNNPAGASIIDAPATMTVSNTLTLTNGVVATNSNILNANGTVSRASCTNTSTSCFISGNLRKPIAAGSSTPSFEVGSGSTYAPISVSVSGASGGNLTASTTAGQHANYGTSGLSATQYVNRWWTLTAGGGLTVTGYNGTFTFANPGDLVGGPNTASLFVKRWNGTAWSSPSSSSSTSTTVTGNTFGTAFGDYAAGN